MARRAGIFSAIRSGYKTTKKAYSIGKKVYKTYTKWEKRLARNCEADRRAQRIKS